MKNNGPSQNTNATYQGRKGISIRLLSVLLCLAAVLATAFSFFELEKAEQHTQSLYELEQERQTCDKAIQQFMDGSDYLTAQVQQFSVKGDPVFMNNYWTEVHETKSRDTALQDILSTNITPEEQRMAVASKDESDSLIQGEIWAMRIVSESIGLDEAAMPAEVAAYRLNAEDAALSAAQKQEAAIAYIFGPDYSTAKSLIRSNVNAFRNEIANRYGEEAMLALSKAKDTSHYMALGIIIFFLFIAGAILCFMRQVISPLVGFSRKLSEYENGRPISLKEHGAREIRQFAAAFNALYTQVDQNTKRLARLGYIDYLTDVPNRASITEYVEGMIADRKQPLGLLIIDIDNFKRFNDTYGHALGDKVLQQVARAICSVQPADSGISGRICGEEFLVVSQNADEKTLGAAAETILQNVRAITAADVKLPDTEGFRVTVSIGGIIWRGELPVDFIRLLSKADKALYTSKHTGKNKYTYFQ